MIEYFYENKGDPTRFSGWDENDLKAEYPVLWSTYSKYLESKEIFECILSHEAAKYRIENNLNER